MTFTLDVEFAQIDCGVCGGVYAITERHRSWCADHGKGWHCPYCETAWGFFSGGRVKELEKKLAQARRDVDWESRKKREAQAEAKHQEARARGYKGAMVKVKKRVAAGVCPACNRTFQNLASHMESQHPGYGG